LKQRIEQSSRPMLAWVVLYPGFASELRRLEQTSFRIPTTVTPSIRSTGNTSRTTSATVTPSIRSTGNRPSGSVSDATIEAVALAAKSMAKEYGKAMSENARKLREAGFSDDVMRKAFSTPRNLKTYMAAARYIQCGGSKQEALKVAAEQAADPDSNTMYYKSYMQCKRAEDDGRMAVTSDTSPADPPADPIRPPRPRRPRRSFEVPTPDMVEEEPLSVWKYAAIGASALAVVGLGIAILK
jgi:hypothetical protein